MILIITIILAWMFIGLITVLISGFIEGVDINYTDCIIAMIAGPSTIAMIILYDLDDKNKLPTWMSKDVMKHLK